jgi:hypothetical protein
MSQANPPVPSSRAHPKLEEQTGAESFLVLLCLHGVLHMLLYSEALWRACLDLHEWNYAAYNALDKNAKKQFSASHWSFVVSRHPTHPLFGTHFNEACCEAWGGGPKLHTLLSVAQA